VERAGDDQVFNRWPVRIRNRAADYKESEYETPDASIPGLDRRASPVDGSWFTDASQAARLSSLLAKRSIYSRNTYRFRIKGKWAALEVMDYVSISEPVTGVSNVLCRIESIRRLRDGSLEIAAREAPEGSAHPVDYTPQTEDGYSHPLPGLTPPPSTPHASLTSEAHVFTAALDGTVSSYAGAVSEINVFVGDEDDSANWTVTKADSLGVTSTLAGRTVTVTAMTAAVDVGYVDLTATQPGYPDIVKRFSLSKSKAGAAGSPGADGDDGAPGAPGSPGAVGPRGSLTLAQNVNPATTWNSASASDYVTSQSASGGVLRLGDTVTQYNDAANFAETRFWDGSSAWVVLSVKINGSLLVAGTVAGEKFAADALEVGYTPATGTLYPDNVSGTYADEGFKVVTAPTGAQYMQIASDGCYVGQWDLSHIVLRVAGSIAYANGDFFYRGGSRGVPIIYEAGLGDRVRVWDHLATYSVPTRGTNQFNGYFNFEITPKATTDNLDALRWIQATLWDNGAPATQMGGVYTVAVPDRLHYSATLGDNQMIVTWLPMASYITGWGGSPVNCVDASSSAFAGKLQITLVNVYGASATRNFGYSGAMGWMTPGVTIGGNSGSSGGSGGSTDPDPISTCVAPETMVLMGNGLWLPAGAIKAGDEVYTLPEDGGAGPGKHRVEAASTHASPRLRLTMEDGRELVTSPDHYLMTTTGWVHTKDLKPAHVIVGQTVGQVRKVEPAEAGPVVKMTIDGAHTYISEGLLSHNAKKL
jgi:hypothetical protein